jgi:hypothetical protein
MTAGVPGILALDFDGVLCEGIREYFETSRRTCAEVWPGEGLPGDDAFPAFKELRPVIETGWEMPVLLRAIGRGRDPREVASAWPATRDALLGEDARPRNALVAALKSTLDEVRRRWIAADRQGWLDHHALYGTAEDIRRLVAEPPRTAIVTTKEGEFARHLLGHWKIDVADVQGKEAGSHKCENLRQLVAAHGAGGGRPVLWFVEDRLETLRCVSTHDDLADVGLFLAGWGYNTAATRASVSGDRRVRLLSLERFTRGLAGWI